jgi:small subunit ribosomal protein S16
VAVKIRLKRLGKVRAPHYRIVVADSRTKRDGRVIEEIGRYIPTENPSFIEVNSERARYWLGVGAQPTEQVEALLKLTGDYQFSKGDKNAKSVVQVKPPKPEFIVDGQKKTVLVPKSEAPAKKAAAEEAPAAEAVESDLVVEEAVVEAATAEVVESDVVAEEAVAEEAAAEVVAEASEAAVEAEHAQEDAVAEAAEEEAETEVSAEEAAVHEIVEEAPAAEAEAEAPAATEEA